MHCALRSLAGALPLLSLVRSWLLSDLAWDLHTRAPVWGIWPVVSTELRASHASIAVMPCLREGGECATEPETPSP